MLNCSGTIFIISHLIVSMRWWFLLRSQSIFVSLWVAVKLYFLGWFYNNFAPGSVGGDAIRAWYVTRHTDRKFEGVLSVFVDRGIWLFSTFCIALFFYCFFRKGESIRKLFEKDGGSEGSFHDGLFLWFLAFLLVLIACRLKSAPLTLVYVPTCVWATNRTFMRVDAISPSRLSKKSSHSSRTAVKPFP